ncbi:MAG: amidotransferase [Pseudomonas sp.]|jgi:GMP synthase-like glutamine amidotransferase|nr:amidotransferase [Pseudomonas sp.]
MTLRICILESDDLHPSMQDSFIGFGQMFKQLFTAQDADVDYQVFNVLNGAYPETDQQFDAYLVTGSKADSFADDPWVVTLRAYLRERFVHGDVLLGICFGHQILALVLGGDTQRSNKGWGLGVHRYHLACKPEWMPEVADEFRLLISHRDQVTALPAAATLLAHSDFCENAAFILGQQVLCFQGHPEFTHGFSKELLQIRQSMYCPKAYQAACQSLQSAHDGQTVAQWMLCFVKAAKKTRDLSVVADQSVTLDSESLCLV